MLINTDEYIFVQMLQINVNGYVTFQRPYTASVPRTFPPTLSIIAPFWSDIDLTSGSGRVFFRCYSRDVILPNPFNASCQNDAGSWPPAARDNCIFEAVQREIKQYYGNTNFQPTMVCVVTWQSVQPYPSKETSNEVH